MKKITLVFLLIILGKPGAAQTTDTMKGFVSTFETRFGTQSSSLPFDKHPEFMAVETEIAPGYGFNPHLSLYVPVALSAGLFDNGGVKNYETTGQIGLALGYSPLHDRRQRLEIIARTGSTLGGNWQFMYYDLGLRYGLGSGAKSGLYVGAGIRYYDTYRGPFDNYCNLYISIGFRVDFLKSN